jgi:hypothetical protein
MTSGRRPAGSAKPVFSSAASAATAGDRVPTTGSNPVVPWPPPAVNASSTTSGATATTSEETSCGVPSRLRTAKATPARTTAVSPGRPGVECSSEPRVSTRR